MFLKSHLKKYKDFIKKYTWRPNILAAALRIPLLRSLERHGTPNLTLSIINNTYNSLFVILHTSRRFFRATRGIFKYQL